MDENYGSMLQSDLVRVSQPRSSKIKILGIELVAALAGLSLGLSMVINTNLIIDKFCNNDLNYSKVICDNLMDEKYEKIQNQVQAEAAKLGMYNTIISSVPAIALSVVLGPASDRFGRKLVLGLPLLGLLISQVIQLGNVYFMEASANYVLLCTVYGMFGGLTCFFIGIYSYMVDISSEETRTSRISIMDASLSAFLSFGIFASAYVYNFLGYYGIYMTTTFLLTIDLCLVVFVLEDSSRGSSAETPTLPTDALLTQPSLIRTVFRRRYGYKRIKLLICFLCFILYMAVFSGELDYLYTRKVLDWDEQTFTKVASLGTIIKCVSSSVALPLLSYYLGLGDTLLGWTATLFLVINQVFIAIARTSTVYVMGVVYGGLTSVTTSILRSLMSKQVPKEELAQVFSMLGFVEGLTPLIMTPLVTILYNNTLNTNPSVVYYYRTALACVCSLGFVVFKSFERKEVSIFSCSQPSESSPLIQDRE